MNYLKYNTATEIIIGPLVGEDGKTPYTGSVLASEVKLSKGSDSSGTITYGAFANATNAPTHMENGLYKLSITAAESSCGVLAVSTVKAGAWLSHWEKFEVLTNMGYGIMRGSTEVPANISKIYGVEVASAAAGYMPCDLRMVSGVAMTTAYAGMIPSDIRMLQGSAIGANAQGYFPTDVRKIDGANLATHVTGYMPIDGNTVIQMVAETEVDIISAVNSARDSINANIDNGVEVSGTTNANVVSIDGNTIAGGQAVLNLKQLSIVNNSGSAVILKTDEPTSGVNDNYPTVQVIRGKSMSSDATGAPIAIDVKCTSNEKSATAFQCSGGTGSDASDILAKEIGATQVNTETIIAGVNVKTFEGADASDTFMSLNNSINSQFTGVHSHLDEIENTLSEELSVNVVKIEGVDATTYFGTLDDATLSAIASARTAILAEVNNLDSPVQSILDIVTSIANRLPAEMSDITKDWIVDGAVSFEKLMVDLLAMMEGNYDFDKVSGVGAFRKQNGTSTAFSNIMTETTRRKA